MEREVVMDCLRKMDDEQINNFVLNFARSLPFSELADLYLSHGNRSTKSKKQILLMSKTTPESEIPRMRKNKTVHKQVYTDFKNRQYVMVDDVKFILDYQSRPGTEGQERDV